MKTFLDLETLRDAKSVCVISHLDPDTDALASLVLTKHFLMTTFGVKKVDLFCEHSGLPNNYLPIIEGEKLNPEIAIYDCAIAVDCPNADRLGIFKELFLKTTKKIVIDHHATNALFGDKNFVETVSSTCQLLFKIMKFFDYPFINQDYGLIYAGIITDTNNFSVGDINSETFAIVSVCEPHINRDLIYSNFLANNTYKNMQILSLAINHLERYLDGKLQISYITFDNEKELAIEQQDYVGVVNRLATIANNKITIFVYPRKDEFYVSLRAKQGYDVSKLAQAHNGGGHIGASGYLTKQSIEEIKAELINHFSTQIDIKPVNQVKIF